MLKPKIELIIHIFILISWLFSLAICSYIFFSTHKDLPVILHFGPQGIDYLGKKIEIFCLPLIGLFFLGINYFLFERLMKKDKNLANYLIYLNILVAILLVILSLKYLFLNR